MVSGANFNLFNYQAQGITNPFSSQRVGGHNPAVEGEFGAKNTKTVGANYNEYAKDQDLFAKMNSMDYELKPESRNELQGQKLYCMG